MPTSFPEFDHEDRVTTHTSSRSAASPPSPPHTGTGRGSADRDQFPLPSSFGLGEGVTGDGPSSWATADPRHDLWTTHDPVPLPNWVTGFRDHQLQAVEEIVDAYNRGAQVVFLDAPTGAGKTLIGEMARRVVGGKALYVCHSLGLQDQFVADFPHAQVLKGRTNYPTQSGNFPEINCGDCDMRRDDATDELECTWCYLPDTCPYQVARDAATRSRLAVLNTAYLLAEANHVGRIAKGRELIIADEADTLEALVMGTAEFRVSARILRRLGIEQPKKGSRAPTVAKWMTDELHPAMKKRIAWLAAAQHVELIRERTQLERIANRIHEVAAQIVGDAWTRDYDRTEAFLLKPVTVDHVAGQMVWRHGKRWLLMSATLVSTKEMQRSLGMDNLRCETVRVPMTFPVENRPIYAIPVAEMTAAKKDGSWPKMATAISHVLERHPGEKVLVHTVSYDLAKYLRANVDAGQRQTYGYLDSRGREDAVERFKRDRRGDGVMFAPSLDRGFDFAGDDARVVIVAKVPYPYLGDRQVSERMHTRGGQEWYTVQTIRSLVQMTGRGVRSADDWAATYILDASFIDRIWRKDRRLLPKWWRDAVDMTVTKRDLGVKS